MTELESTELRARVTNNLQKDDTGYVQEFGQLLTDEHISRGVELELGNDPEAAQRLSDLMGIDEALRDSSLSVVSLIIANHTGHSIRGSLWEFARTNGVVTSLPLIQADDWGNMKYPVLQSYITVGEAIHKIHELTVVKTKPVMSFTARANYTAAAQKKFTRLYTETLPAYGKEDATRFTRPNEARFPAIALKRYLDATGESVDIPINQYSMTVGPADFGYGAITARAENAFKLKDGHFVRQKRY